MQDCKLSFIIPLFNAGKFLSTCLDSILKSELPKNQYEIIIVNDGSEDEGPEIAQKFHSDYTNVRYFTQENQGQSVARNAGIQEAKGEYIWCIDADDYLKTDSLVQIWNQLALNYQLDVLAIQLKQQTEEREFIRIECTQPSIPKGVIYSGKEAVIKGYNPSSVCALIIRKRLMTEHQLLFKVGITHQDVELSYRLMCHAQSVLFSNIIAYNYILHPNSTSQSLIPKKKIKYLSDDIVIMESFSNLAKSFEKDDKELSATIRQRICDIHLGMILNLYRNRKVWGPSGIVKGVLLNMKMKGYFPPRESFGSFKKNILSKFLTWTLNKNL
jgi:GT2 family glycosyltransferase